jgi:hypothetical protein
MVVHYISLGYDCSPAAALKNLDMREEALPFDWVESNLQIIINCIEDSFNNYHKNLYFNNKKTRLIDSYGFEFPHDYPFNTNFEKESIGEGIFGEESNKSIVENWIDYHSIALEKYQRRIKRFYSYLQSNEPVIFLCRNKSVNNLKKFGNYLSNKFNKNNIFFIVSSNESYQGKFILTCNTERNGVWNEASIWLESINKIKKMHNLL